MIVQEAAQKTPWMTLVSRPDCGRRILGSGVIAAFDPAAAKAIGDGMTSYLAALPEALYALFGTGYLGYTAARQWGKVKGVER